MYVWEIKGVLPKDMMLQGHNIRDSSVNFVLTLRLPLFFQYALLVLVVMAAEIVAAVLALIYKQRVRSSMNSLNVLL